MCRFSPGRKSVEAWRLPPTQCSAEVKERVLVYLYTPSGLSWSVLGWPLLSHFIEKINGNGKKDRKVWWNITQGQYYVVLWSSWKIKNISVTRGKANQTVQPDIHISSLLYRNALNTDPGKGQQMSAAGCRTQPPRTANVLSGRLSARASHNEVFGESYC